MLEEVTALTGKGVGLYKSMDVLHNDTGLAFRDMHFIL